MADRDNEKDGPEDKAESEDESRTGDEQAAINRENGVPPPGGIAGRTESCWLERPSVGPHSMERRDLQAAGFRPSQGG